MFGAICGATAAVVSCAAIAGGSAARGVGVDSGRAALGRGAGSDVTRASFSSGTGAGGKTDRVGVVAADTEAASDGSTGATVEAGFVSAEGTGAIVFVSVTDGATDASCCCGAEIFFGSLRPL